MIKVGDKVLTPRAEAGVVVSIIDDLYYVALDGKNAVDLCEFVMEHPDNEYLRQQCNLMCRGEKE